MYAISWAWLNTGMLRECMGNGGNINQLGV